MRLLALALLIAAGQGLAQTEGPFSSLEEQMSGDEFRRAGLEKLSPAELEALNAWLRARSTVQSATPSARSAPAPAPAEDRRGFENRRDDETPIETRLVGEFTGWTGKTRFELDNGQVWQQTRGGSYRAPKTTAPRVRLEPKALGTWALTVDGVSRAVRVKRIK